MVSAASNLTLDRGGWDQFKSCDGCNPEILGSPVEGSIVFFPTTPGCSSILYMPSPTTATICLKVVQVKRLQAQEEEANVYPI